VSSLKGWSLDWVGWSWSDTRSKLDKSIVLSFHALSLLSFTSSMDTCQDFSGVKRLCQREEPLLFNSALNTDIFKDISFRKSVWAAKITKIGHLPEGEWISAETFAGKLGIRSVRVATKILTQIIESLPQNYRLSLYWRAVHLWLPRIKHCSGDWKLGRNWGRNFIF